MQEISFSIRHEGCPFNEISGRHHGSEIWHWCNRKNGVFEFRHPDVRILGKQIERTIHSGEGRIRHKYYGLHDGAIVSRGRKSCACPRALEVAGTHSVTDVVESHLCVGFQPIICKEGWEYRRIVAFKEPETNRLFRALDRLGETEILGREDLDSTASGRLLMVPVSGLFTLLTEKQHSALAEALNMGYYQLPRQANVLAIAEARGTPRTTYEEHLRKAEAKVMKSIAPYLTLYSPEAQEMNAAGK